MIYQILADITVVLHIAYVAFVVIGLLLIGIGGFCEWSWVRNRWFRAIHLLMILIVVVEAWLGIVCPLTTWEQEFRSAAGQQTYQGDFIARWAHELLFFDAPAWVFTVCYTVFGGLVLATLWFVPPKWRPSIRAADVSASG